MFILNFLAVEREVHDQKGECLLNRTGTQLWMALGSKSNTHTHTKGQWVIEHRAFMRDTEVDFTLFFPRMPVKVGENDKDINSARRLKEPPNPISLSYNYNTDITQECLFPSPFACCWARLWSKPNCMWHSAVFSNESPENLSLCCGWRADLFSVETRQADGGDWHPFTKMGLTCLSRWKLPCPHTKMSCRGSSGPTQACWEKQPCDGPRIGTGAWLRPWSSTPQCGRDGFG